MRWLWNLVRRRRIHRELAEEVASHLEEKTAELMECGMSERQARQIAMREFGNATLYTEISREVWGWMTLERFGQDLRFGLRMLRRNLGFTAVAVLTLALGIGANSAIFSMLDAVMLRPLPVKDPEQIVEIATRTGTGGLHADFSYPLYAALRQSSDAFSGIAAYSRSTFGIGAPGQADRVPGAYVSADYFSVLGVQPAIGSGFGPNDESPGAPRSAVISYGLWQRWLGGDPAVQQKTITLNGYNFAVRAVAPRSFTGNVRGRPEDVWITLPHYADLGDSPGVMADPRTSWLALTGRLKPGIHIQEAQLRMTAQWPAGLAPDRNPGSWTAVLTPASGGNDVFVRDMRKPLGVLFVAVVLILGIACANVTSLLLARAQVRRKEMALRLALGATWTRLIRQLLTESLLLSLAGGAAGVFVATVTSGLYSGLPVSADEALTLDLSLNVRAFAFALAVSLVTALFLGVVTAWCACRVDLVPVLKEGAETVRPLRRWISLRNILVSGQIAMSLILLMGMGLFLRSLSKLQSIDVGFSGRQVLVLSLDLEEQRYTPERGKSFYADAMERISALPGVKSASLASSVPVTAGGRRMDLPPNFTNPPINEPTRIDMISVAPRFFETIGLPLLRGRDFGPLDSEKAPNTIIVNETMARIYWLDSDPIGRRLLIGKSAFEVVAVARDTKYRELRETARATMYTPLAQSYRPRMNVLVRTARPPMDLAPIVREQLRALDSTLPAFDIRTLSEHVGRSLYIERIQSLLTSALGLLGLLLTSIGVYGMVAHTVAQRTHEIGIRMALGAQAGAVRTLMLRRSLYATLGGMVVGLLASFSLARLVENQLYAISATDPLTMVAVTLLLVVVALVASYLPARRAAKVDPVVALRYE